MNADLTMMIDPPVGRVLVVDDEEPIRAVLDRQLRRLGHEVIQANDGQSGLSAVIDARPDVILCDLRMPNLDGLTFARRLSSLNTGACMIAMSGRGTLDDVIDMLHAGVVDYLKKPWSVSDLASALERAFARRRESQAAARAQAQAQTGASDSSERNRGASAPAEAAPSAEGDPFADLLAKLRAGELPIPAIPGTLLALRSAVVRPDIDLNKIVGLVEQDQRLAADVLRLANTAQYARAGRLDSIKLAVSRIGFRQLHNLVETILLKESFVAQDGEVQAALHEVWRRSVARATVMRDLVSAIAAAPSARFCRDSAYFAGLMADVGASLMLWLTDRRMGAGMKTKIADCLSAVRASHHEVGAALLGRWIVNPAVIASVARHHAPAGTGLTDDVALMILSSSLINRFQGVPPDLTEPAPPSPETVETCRKRFGLSQAHINELALEAHDRFQEAMAIIA